MEILSVGAAAAVGDTPITSSTNESVNQRSRYTENLLSLKDRTSVKNKHSLVSSPGFESEECYFAASCAQLARVVRKGLAAGGGSTSPVNAALKVTMCP